MANRRVRDHKSDGWEPSDFPIVCESCLGNNPYTRYERAEDGKECKTCKRPFTEARWRQQSRDSRYKKTEICRNCSRLKNVCQACILDLDNGLPCRVRDTALHVDPNDTIPNSGVNREYLAEEHERG